MMKTKEQNDSKITIRLSGWHAVSFCQMKEQYGKNSSELVRGMIDAGYYINRQEVTANAVRLMDSIHRLEGVCDRNNYERVKKAGEDVCRSLLIN